MGKRNGKMKWEIEKILIFFFNFSVSDLLFITEERNDCRERNKLMARKEMSFEEQIITKNNYIIIYISRKTEAITFLILKIFCETREKIFTNNLMF